jgi:predicted RND superfamily exporter protein
MTKKSAEFMALLEASKLVNKSVRTLKRYLDKVDKVDKSRMSTLSKGRILVSLEFVDLVKSGFFKNSIIKQVQEPFEEKKEIPNEKDKRIETLESKNKELFDIIKDKDKQLQGKDELIKENLQDFKLLTSKVLFLQERNVELQQPVKEKAQEEIQNVTQGTLGFPNFSDSLLLFFAVGFIGLVVLVGYLVLN